MKIALIAISSGMAHAAYDIGDERYIRTDRAVEDIDEEQAGVTRRRVYLSLWCIP